MHSLQKPLEGAVQRVPLPPKSLNWEEVKEYRDAEGERIHAPVVRPLTCCEKQFNFGKTSFLMLKLILTRIVLVLLFISILQIYFDFIVIPKLQVIGIFT